MSDEVGESADLRAAAQALEDRTQPLERVAAAWQGRRADDPVTAQLGDSLVDAAAALRSYRRLVDLLLRQRSWSELVDDLDAVNAKLDEARSWARWGYRHVDEGTRIVVGETPLWLLDEVQGRPEPRRLDADLNNEDDHGHGWTLVDVTSFDPSWVYPGAVIDVGREGGHGMATVLGTDLIEKTSGGPAVVVTFRLD